MMRIQPLEVQEGIGHPVVQLSGPSSPNRRLDGRGPPLRPRPLDTLHFIGDMSYPTPRYLGENGDISALFRLASTEPELISESGQRIHYLATDASTRGEFGLYRVDMGPRSPGPSTHFHRTISESFFILSGTMQLFNGERWIRANEGDYLYVPAGGLHAFRNESDDPASMLMLFAPGAPREEYFEKVAEMAKRGGQEFAEFLVRHDSYFVDAWGGPDQA
jgi:mannose-6-phosphate isomerase-like protein (cupin superfamily)